jgi:hypothetical protein
MRFDKRVLLGGLGVALVIAVGTYEYIHSEDTSTNARLPKPVDHPVMQQEVTTESSQKKKRVLTAEHSAVTTIDWNKEFKTSTDYFTLISKAAKAGLEGDGRAAYYVSRKWLECRSLAGQYGGAEHPEQKFNDDMSHYAYAPPELIEKKRTQFQRCAGFYKSNDPNGNDVFADLPKQDGGYQSVKFWMDLAYQDNDPIAQTVHAAVAVSSMSPSPDQIQVAQADLNKAIASGDPEAIFQAGMVITNGHYVDRIEGFALSLAACDLGYDCTAANNAAELPFGECVTMGTCPAGSTFSDWVTKNLGAEGYTQAYVRAQQIKYAFAQEDTAALQQFAQLIEKN